MTWALLPYFILTSLVGLVLGGMLALWLKPPQRRQRSVAEHVETMRNLLSFMLVSAFIGALVTLTHKGIPEQNKDLLTYMLGQLSGMATMALGFYFVNKAGQDAADAKRADNTGKLADAARESAQVARAAMQGTGDGGDTKQAEAAGAQDAANAAQETADDKKSQAAKPSP